LSNLSKPYVPRDQWQLDSDVTFLNHGSFGAVPRSLVAEQQRLLARMELNPTKFLTFELPTALRTAASRLAEFFGGFSADYVFIENATAGCNTVLASIQLSPDDEILLTDHCYPAILKAAQYAASRTGAKVVEAKVPFPVLDKADVIKAVESRLGSRTRLAILDHVTSPTAVIFPVRELTTLCPVHRCSLMAPTRRGCCHSMCPRSVPIGMWGIATNGLWHRGVADSYGHRRLDRLQPTHW
jgi:isopenicillin-N epimerase